MHKISVALAGWEESGMYCNTFIAFQSEVW